MTGRPLWQKWIDQEVMTVPVVHGDAAYIVTFAGTLYKFRLSDGEILLARRCRATSAPVVLDDGIYLTRRVDAGRDMPQECLVKLNRRTGAERDAAQCRWAPYLADPASARRASESQPVAGYRGGCPRQRYPEGQKADARRCGLRRGRPAGAAGATAAG